ncbi:MAG: hypothetical protein KAJ75_04630, partial [Alphaproteobacteria bacterium]|nr:hypothetical protein [Alphaproteobacteria bacterium]
TGETAGEENDLAKGYTAPEAVEYEEESAPVVSMESTTDGCEVRIDIAQGVAIEQTKTQTMTDGVVTNEGVCSDTLNRYIIKENSCENIVDVASMTVYPQYRASYVDTAGVSHEVSECMPDNSLAMELSEEESSCTPEIDYAGNLVKFKTALVYTDASGAVQQARSCEVSATIPPVELKESTESCPLRHDYENNNSYEMSLKYYEQDGETFQATACVDTDRVFAQTNAYGDCPAIINQEGKTVTLQYKKQITIDGIPQYITACTPDATSQNITPTTEGCSIRHDLAVDTSYKQERYYYIENGQTIYLDNGCMDSDVTYTHDHEIVGWDNHDDQMFSYPKMKVTIT